MNHFFMHAPKWRTGAGVLTLLAWLTSCGPNNKAVEYPLIETANTNALDIAKVELSYHPAHRRVLPSPQLDSHFFGVVPASRRKTVYADRCRGNHSGLTFLDARIGRSFIFPLLRAAPFRHDIIRLYRIRLRGLFQALRDRPDGEKNIRHTG